MLIKVGVENQTIKPDFLYLTCKDLNLLIQEIGGVRSLSINSHSIYGWLFLN